MSDNTFCASRCVNYDCEKHASNVESGWIVQWKDMHHNCRDFIALDSQFTFEVQEGD